MNHPAERIRSAIRQQFYNFGASEDVQTEETILISDGYYCGRRFRCDGFEAIWFIEENQIKFFDQDGTVRLTQSATPAETPAETPAASSQEQAAEPAEEHRRAA